MEWLEVASKEKLKAAVRLAERNFDAIDRIGAWMRTAYGEATVIAGRTRDRLRAGEVEEE